MNLNLLIFDYLEGEDNREKILQIIEILLREYYEC
jgi:hypothetical protein